MFGKKKEKEKEKVIRVCLKGEEVYRGTMTDLPLKEEIILSKSDEFFNDPNPCFIHRSAEHRMNLLHIFCVANPRKEFDKHLILLV